MSEWNKIARAKFGDVSVTSHGRFALCSLDASGKVRSVYLLESREQAERAALGVDRARIVDLELSPSSSCPVPRKCSVSFGYE
jgi:hypothetical protein